MVPPCRGDNVTIFTLDHEVEIRRGSDRTATPTATPAILWGEPTRSVLAGSARMPLLIFSFSHMVPGLGPPPASDPQRAAVVRTIRHLLLPLKEALK
jgi:hypothetical protein